MGVSFSYFTTEDVSDEQRTQIQNEADSLNNAREWTSTEAILFFDMDGYESKIFGDSKFFMDSIAAEPDGITDAQFIIDSLASWSQKLGVSWQITAEGADVGVIENGEPDDAVHGFVQTLGNPTLFDF